MAGVSPLVRRNRILTCCSESEAWPSCAPVGKDGGAAKDDLTRARVFFSLFFSVFLFFFGLWDDRQPLSIMDLMQPLPSPSARWRADATGMRGSTVAID